jgi:peroxiredoxin Q/BCP
MIGAYGAWGIKKMHGKESAGVIRSSVLVDAEGIVRHIWPKARSKGHAREVLDHLKQME